jgi:hypothetical protein
MGTQLLLCTRTGVLATVVRTYKSWSPLPGTVRCHIQPSWALGVVPPSATATVPLAVFRCSLFDILFAVIHLFR